MATNKNLGAILVDKAKELDPTYEPDNRNDLAEATEIILDNIGGTTPTPGASRFDSLIDREGPGLTVSLTDEGENQRIEWGIYNDEDSEVNFFEIEPYWFQMYAENDDGSEYSAAQISAHKVYLYRNDNESDFYSEMDFENDARNYSYGSAKALSLNAGQKWIEIDGNKLITFANEEENGETVLYFIDKKGSTDSHKWRYICYVFSASGIRCEERDYWNMRTVVSSTQIWPAA